MSTYTDASLIYYPSGYKAGKAYSLKPTDGTGDLTFIRASTATRVNESGLIESVATGVPRIDYTGGGCAKLLLEPQRANLVTYSSEFDNAAWVKFQVTVTGNTTTSPDGTTNADTLNIGVDVSATRHRLYSNVVTSQTIGTTYTATYYLKKSSHRWIQILGNIGYSTGVWANFDLENGVIGNTGGVDTTASIENAGNGWYRCRVSGVATGTSTTGFEILVINNTNGGRYPSYQSLVAESVCFVWGAQTENGSYPTSYIPTTTTAVTRVADAFTRDNIYTNGLITASGGTWFAELRGNLSYTATGFLRLGVGDTNTLSTNSLILRTTGTSRIIISKIVGGSASTLYNTLTDSVKIAIKWNGTSADVFVNGVKEVSAASFTTTNMNFFNGGINSPILIQSTMLFPTAKSDAELIALTTI